MDDKVDLCDLHGVVLNSEESNDPGYFGDNLSADDVFIGEGIAVQNIDKSEAGELRTISKNQKNTFRSSGYESEAISLEVGTENTSESRFCFEPLRKPKQPQKEIKNVFSQTDFPLDEDVKPAVNKLPQPTSPIQTQNHSHNTIDHFCWRHDSVYDKLIFPPARPSSTSSIDRNPDLQRGIPPQKVSLSNKSCSRCKIQTTTRIDLNTRKLSVSLSKESLLPSVAEVKDCALNLLPDQIENCSNLWTENRTFYLGTPRKKPCPNTDKQRSRSFPGYPDEQYPYNDDVFETEANLHRRPSSKPLFWMQKTSFACDKIFAPMKPESKQKNKRDWILVQPVSKFVLRNRSSDTELKTSYKSYGEQEMILCPHDLRSVDYIEEICCLHFINVTRKAAKDEKRILELLFSPKGPIIREDKHLEGRSVFFFCCDHPIKAKKLRKSSSQEEKLVDQEDDLFKFGLNKTSHLNRKDMTLKRQEAVCKNVSDLPFSGYPHCASAFTKTIQQDSEETPAESYDDPMNNSMKKNVRFEETSKKDVETVKKSINEKSKGLKDTSRRAPYPPLPPPPEFSEKPDIKMQRKRRESVAISFGNNDKKEEGEIKEKKIVSVNAYEKPKFENVKISVKYEDKTYETEFPEYQTLEDLYSWIKKQLLNDNLFSTGSTLLLSSDKDKFPLKANTATNSIISLSSFNFTCFQILQSKQGTGFGDTNSRYDTRFAIPIDMRNLENLTPIQYLSAYCHVSETWRLFYCNVFAQNDQDRDGLLSYKELKKAMQKLFVELAHPLLKRVLLLTGFDPSARKDQSHLTNMDDEEWKKKLKIDRRSFVNLCALANRIICRETKIDGFSVETINQSNTQLEDADFYDIEGKLTECNLNPLTKRLLLYVKR